MIRNILILILLVALPAGWQNSRGEAQAASFEERCHGIYEELGLSGKVAYAAFSELLAGYYALGDNVRGIVTLVDFTRPSDEERLWVLDLEAQKVLFHSLVAHGRGSGERYATSFSNVEGSHKSSLGFFLTAGTYQGANGYSLVLDGLEKGINDQARQRAIVIHPADYCTEAFARANGRLGRSWGCPALPPAICRSVIDTIKDGTLLYIYAANQNYLTQSKVLGRGDQSAT